MKKLTNLLLLLSVSAPLAPRLGVTPATRQQRPQNKPDSNGNPFCEERAKRLEGKAGRLNSQG